MPKLPIPSCAIHHADAQPYLDPRDGGTSAALPEAGVLVSLRGITYVVALPAREHAKASLWRTLAGWRDRAE
ncbi:hypothetical protein [Burkholderia gladioli]|uniref:Uncharacterized protein n=1 Tax=Burkholderia gladioli (strain BSR3) TaxID=999541 RepID=F2LQQ5_BURGS|nr:hypothetical protein [Burkholderia gladioli]AEA64994.1 hypothetical protein bgla_2g25660 [Burkholderia gladioli BSR3]MBU9683363.1 hypothetical protein [Burkholderia gladioli]MBW5283217.1 hypothetical protein [Burkholderia gladioli]MCA8168900.1 hypothetical protein [Burkholderia gladioli]MDD1785342.1 hypothetical protein [Burkholderia gladioli]